MKQMAFMVFTSMLGVVGSFTLSPVWGVAIYYLYAVLRPQGIWEWADAFGTNLGDIGWSFYVATATLIATILWRLGVIAPVAASKPPWYGNPRYTRSHYLFLIFTVWISLTYFTATSQDRAWPWFLEYIKIFAMVICATLVLRTVRELWVLYFVVLGCATYAAYEINFFYFVDGWMYLQSRGYGGLDNNGAALIVAMAVPMAYFAWEATSHRIRWLFLLFIPILIHALMLSFSRGGMLALAVTAGLVWLRSRHKVFLSLVYLAAGVFIAVTAGKEIQERFLSITKSDADGSAQSRLTTWNIAVRMANEKPIFGFGIRCSNLYTFEYGADIEGRSIHSQYLQIAADSGWVACILYVTLLGSMFYGLWRVRRFIRHYNDPETLRVRSLAAGLECALFLFCFGAIFLSLEHFEMPYCLILMAIQLEAITRRVSFYYHRGGTLEVPMAVVWAVPQPEPEPENLPLAEAEPEAEREPESEEDDERDPGDA